MYLINELKSEYFYDTDFTYFQQSHLFYVFDALKYVDKNILSQFCRPVLTKHWHGLGFVLNYLFWYENIDLNHLDKKVILSTYQDMDFLHSIKCDFIPNFYCLNCNYSYENILIIDSNPIYINNFSLADKKLAYIRNHHKGLKCKNCNHNFNRLIMHIFGKS